MKVSSSDINLLLQQYSTFSSSGISQEELRNYIDSVSFFHDVLHFSRTVILIVEYQTMNYLFCSSNSREIMGLSPEEVMQKGPPFVLSMGHPQHVSAYNNFLPQTLTFFSALPPEQRSRHKFSFTISLRKNQGKTTSFLQHNYFLKWSETGKPLIKLIALTDITEYRKNNDDVLFFITRSSDNGRNEIISHRIFSKQQHDKFTEREVEVLGLFSAGHSPAQISSLLKISEHTIKNYKKNIIKKMASRNMAQAISLARLYGFIRDNANAIPS